MIKKHANVCVACKGEADKELPRCPLCQRPFCTKDMPNHVCKMLRYKMIVLVRKDLKMTPGKVAAQVLHAGIELAKLDLEGNIKYSRTFEEWDKEGGRAVILAVENEEDMNRVENLCNYYKLPHKAYRDGGITEVHPNTLTVLGIGPVLASCVDKITEGFDSY